MFLIAERLIILRDHAGFTQKEIAGLLRISRSAYSNYENNNREPSLEILHSIAKLYDVPMCYLLGDTSLSYDEKTKKYTNPKPFITALSGDEIILLNYYKALDSVSKQKVLKLIKNSKSKS